MFSIKNYILKGGKVFNNSFWIGLNELSTIGGYVWSDGSPVNYGKIKTLKNKTLNTNLIYN